MSMSNSLEVRGPLMDQQLLSWVLRLPFGLRFRFVHGKKLLRKVTARCLPRVIQKQRKQGFTTPMGLWLRGRLKDFATAILRSDVFRQRGLIKPDSAMQLLKMQLSGRYEFEHRIWQIIMLEIRARRWSSRAC
jgi:asparagine synthase (glutamine-hydrolysing)